MKNSDVLVAKKTATVGKGEINQAEGSTTREARDLAIRYKRQRAATEALHLLARKEKIVLVKDSVAELYQIPIWDKGVKQYLYVYAIVSLDQSKLLYYDMATGGAYVNPFNRAKLDVPAVVTAMYKSGNGFVEMGIDLGVAPDGSPSSVPANFNFGVWYVLEIMSDGHFFYVQREFTAKLRQCADEQEVDYHVHCRDKLSSRAKICTVNDKTCWSLVGQYHGTNKVCYVVYDPESDEFTITSEVPKLWIMQQRVAFRKIREFAKAKGLTIYGKPYLASDDEYERDVWAVNADKGVVVCSIQEGLVYATDYEKLSGVTVHQMACNESFEYEVCGMKIQPTPWIEAEIINCRR